MHSIVSTYEYVIDVSAESYQVIISAYLTVWKSSEKSGPGTLSWPGALSNQLDFVVWGTIFEDDQKSSPFCGNALILNSGERNQVWWAYCQEACHWYIMHVPNLGRFLHSINRKSESPESTSGGVNFSSVLPRTTFQFFIYRRTESG